MLKENKDISKPIKGMNSDVHPIDLKDVDYSFALNANYEDSSGNGYPLLQNEHSNILCSRFNEGFKVNGLHVDIVNNKTYYFLTNPTNNTSEIGVIGSNTDYEDTEDKDSNCGCTPIKDLSTPLEEIENPLPICTYNVIIDDYSCGEGEEGYGCLGFDINYPIQSELKRDKGGDILYFTDDKNPRRRIELSNIEQYKKKFIEAEENCGLEEEGVCINCERMMVNPPYKVATFKEKSVVVGGFLKHGIYLFALCYCDRNRNKLTRYMSLTREIPIKDDNKTIYQQPELDARTNLAIRLELENLDITYENYKVVAIQITSVDGAYSVYEVGIFPTSQTTVIYATEENALRVPIEEVYSIFPIIKTARNIESANNMLFFSDLTTQEEINLQPVVNLMGQFFRWRTHIAEEDLYSKPDLIAKYKEFSRDEVYPLSIRFFNDEYFTPNYPLISRVANNNDLYFDGEYTADDIDSENIENGWQTDVYSVLRTNQCKNSDRKYKWQFYNTATVEKRELWKDLDCDLEVPTEVVTRTLTRYCNRVINKDLTNYADDDGKIIFNKNQLLGVDTFESLNSFIGYVYGIGEESKLSFLTEVNNSISCEDLDCYVDELFPNTCIDNEARLTKDYIEFYSIQPKGFVDEVEIQGTNLLFSEASQTYTEVVTTTNNEDASGLEINFSRDADGILLVDSVYAEGEGYKVGDEIYVSGSDVGGSDDVVLLVTSVKDVSVEIIQECDIDVNKPSICNNIRKNESGNNQNLFEVPSKSDCDEAADKAAEAFADGDYPTALDVEDVKKYVYRELYWEFTPLVFVDWELIGNGDSCKKSRRISRRIDVWDREEIYYGGEDCINASIIPIDKDALSTHFAPYFFMDTMTTDIATIVSDPYGEIPDHITNIDAHQVVGTETLELIRRCRKAKDNQLGYFLDKVAINALWFKIENIDPKNWVSVAISGQGGCPSKRKRDCLLYSDNMRYSMYAVEQGDGCSAVTTPIKGDVFGIRTGTVICIDLDNPLYSLDTSKTYTVYIALDLPYYLEEIDPAKEWQEEGTDYTIMGYATATCGCINIKAENSVITRIELSDLENAEIIVEKICEYKKDCDVEIIGDIPCETIPWEEGKFAYNESLEQYPNNSFLYDSSDLDISPNDIPEKIRMEFEEAFVDSITNKYVLNNETNFTCKGIRHFRFPDETISPHQDGDFLDGGNKPFSNNKIFPLGFHIDNDVVNAFLDLAVKNSLITQEFRNGIKGYEIFVGDIRLEQSILGKGILIDTYKYKDFNEDILFPNFPYNQLGSNNLLFNDKERTKPLIHPYASQKNNRFIFHSPEIANNKPLVPFETHIKGYVLGDSRGRFSEVDRHPQMVLLSRRGQNLAKSLAITEEALETALFTAQQFVIGATGGSLTVGVGLGLAGAASVIRATQSFFNVPIKRFEWEKILYDFGNPNNFAAYYSSVGHYNSFYKTTAEGNKIRLNLKTQYIKSGRYRFTENDFTTTKKQEEIQLNNQHRESGLYLSFGLNENNNNYGFLYHPSQVRNYDNSRFYLGQTGLCSENNDDKKSNEIKRSIANPYASLKSYLPSQHGSIDSIQWLTTGYTSFLDRNNECSTIFGGDTFIGRYTFKTKFSFFLNPMILGKTRLADRTAFNYEEQRNIGYPKFYVKYKTAQATALVGIQLPPIQSEYRLDCNTTQRLYVKPPSKFYLYYYGIPSFLVESKINLNYRYGRNTAEEDFYPNAGDYIDWTQEDNVSVREDNKFFYNNTYSRSYERGFYYTKKLPFNYHPEQWRKKSDFYDRVVYSITDGNEQDLVDNWRIFLAKNFYNFGSQYGRLIGLKSLESQKILARFEDGLIVFNAFNTLPGTVEDVQLGSGKMFETRPTELFKSDLGHGGTQHTAFISCPFGHFWTDAKRGRVYQLTAGGSMGIEEISSYGMKNWFRENLPLKIRKYYPTLPLEFTDNPYNGLGIAMGWDDRFSRLFITKLDYRPKTNCITFENGKFVYNKTECEDAPQITTCPQGYTYNEETEQCEKETTFPLTKQYTVAKCPEGFVYNTETEVCERVDGNCTETTPPRECVSVEQDVECDYTHEFVVTRICPVCPEGYTYNSETEICEMVVPDCEETEDVDIIFVMPNNRFSSDDNEIKIVADDLLTALVPSIVAEKTRVGIVKYGKISAITLPLTDDVPVISAAINGYHPVGGFEHNLLGGLTEADSALSGSTATNKKIVVFVREAVDTLVGSPASTSAIEDTLDLADTIKTSGIDIVLVSAGTSSQVSSVNDIYGGCDLANIDPNYPLSSTGNGVCIFDGQRATHELNIYEYSETVENIMQDLIVCGTETLTESPDCDCDVVEQNCVCEDSIIDEIIISRCPDGFTYNLNTEKCERIVEGVVQHTDLSICGNTECEELEQECDCEQTFTVIQKEVAEPSLVDDVIEISVTDEDYFEPLSWTIAYSPITKSWISFYSFTPNYYETYPNYFKTGLNFTDKKGVYSHLLTNKSYQVFYGDKYPFQVEFPIQNKYVNKIKGSLTYFLDVKRYHNEFDYANNNNIGFNRAWVYGDSENTGNLNLVRTQQGNLFQQISYPKFNPTSIDILYTAEDRKHSINYLFDNVIDKFNNVPIWNNNPNNVGKQINNNAISYLPRYKNHLKGDWLKVLLSQDEETRYKIILKWFESKNKADV